jgi:hypothetical protein
MGKAARNRRRLSEQPKRRSAFARALREGEWLVANATDPIQYHAGLAITRLLPREGRSIIFDPEQAHALRTIDRETVKAVMGDARLPFPVTVLDFGDVPMDSHRVLVGAIGFDEMLVSRDTAERDGDYIVQIVGYFRGTDNWWSLYTGSGMQREHGGGPVAYIDPPPETSGVFVQSGPTAAACGALMVLESANVDLVPTAGPPKGHVAHGRPHYSVSIKQPTRRTMRRNAEPVERDWSHRWEVRGHFKHYGEDTPVGRSNPGRIIETSTHGRCVRIWCPPHVKGPSDKPLIPKVRKLA